MWTLPWFLSVSAALVSVLLWLLALPFTALHYDNVDYSGLLMLMLGWMGPGAWQFGWYGNLPLWVGWALAVVPVSGVRWFAVPCALLGLLVAATSFPTLCGTELIESGVSSSGPLRSFGPAIYLWFASFVVLLLGVCTSAALDLLRLGVTRFGTRPGGR